MQLILSDLHLEDSLLTEYRWGIFDFLEDIIDTYDIDSLYILGDITEKKDNHSSKLVNRIIDNLLRFRQKIFILKGNHDYFDVPFFKFLSYISNIRFIDEQLLLDNGDLFIPYSKSLDIPKLQYKRLFLHHEFKGARLHNGYVLDTGLDPIPSDCVIFSGHIHMKQVLNNIIYIGAPYPIYFGDNGYNGGVFITEEDNYKFIPYRTIGRWGVTISSVDELKYMQLKPNDQIKLKLRLSRGDLHMFDDIVGEIRAYLKNIDVSLISVTLDTPKTTERHESEYSKKETPVEIVEKFSQTEKLPEPYTYRGKEIVS